MYVYLKALENYQNKNDLRGNNSKGKGDATVQFALKYAVSQEMAKNLSGAFGIVMKLGYINWISGSTKEECP